MTKDLMPHSGERKTKKQTAMGNWEILVGEIKETGLSWPPDMKLNHRGWTLQDIDPK